MKQQQKYLLASMASLAAAVVVLSLPAPLVATDAVPPGFCGGDVVPSCNECTEEFCNPFPEMQCTETCSPIPFPDGSRWCDCEQFR